MNIKNLLVVLSSAAVLTSCSSAYRSGQTPDDVYYSPSRPQEDEYVDVQRQQSRYDDRNTNSYDDYDAYRDDRFLRMSMGSPYRLSAYNDYMLYNGYMGFNNFRYNSLSMGFNNPWNSFYYWNSFYNPYTSFDYYNPYYYGGGGFGGGFFPGTGGGVIGKSPSVNPISRPRTFNPGAYTPNTLGNASRYLDRPASANSSYRTPLNNGSRYNNRNSNNSGIGNTMRRVLGGNGENSYYNNGRTTNSSSNSRNSGNNNTYQAPQRSYEAPTRSYSPPPASSGGGNSGGGGGGGVSRPTRGGN